MKNFLQVSILIIWLAISLIENIFPHVVDKKTFFWRPWEYVVNDDSLNVGTIPLKPMQNVVFNTTYDWTRSIYFMPSKEEQFKQEFITDEYGFRNLPNADLTDLDIVILGTSQVAGASETQDNIVSSILKKQYKINAYTYAKSVLQQFWQDERFVRNPPKNVLILGTYEELIEKTNLTSLVNSSELLTFKPWSVADWRIIDSKDRLLHTDYSLIKNYVKRFSAVRLAGFQLYRNLLNIVLDRVQLADIFGKGGYIYDPKNGYLFTTQSQIPATDSGLQLTREKTDALINRLDTVDKLLKTRGINLIVGVMPSKALLHSEHYGTNIVEIQAINLLDKKIDEMGIERIHLFEVVYPKRRDGQYYYLLDSHWNSRTNHIISRLISEKITPLAD